MSARGGAKVIYTRERTESRAASQMEEQIDTISGKNTIKYKNKLAKEDPIKECNVNQCIQLDMCTNIT